MDQDIPTEQFDAAISKMVRDAERNVERAKVLRREMEAIRGCAESDQDGVYVEVDASGRPTELRLESDAMELEGSELASLILDLMARAHADAGRQAVAVANSTYGEDSPTAQQVRQTQLTYNRQYAEEQRNEGR